VTKFLLPVGLSFIYPKWAIDPRLAWQWAFPIGVIVALFALWRMRGRWGRGPLVAALTFVGTLVPALGFFNIYPMRYTFVADHYAYLATPAMIALIAAGVARWPVVVRSAIVAILLVLTMIRASIFADSEKLWRDTLAKNPDSWMVNLNLAKTLAGEDEPAKAWPLFARVVQLAPDLPEAHWNYGISLAEQGKLDEAVAEQTKAIALGGDPLPQAYRSRGLALMKLNRLDEAAADFQSAIHLKPDFVPAYLNLKDVYVRQGRMDEAREVFKRAAEIDPSVLTPPPAPQP
jgi:tetratricopeptide (TPR) repeat protein